MKTICKACFLAVGILSLGHSVTAQETEINDMTTPLHLLQPEYKVPYGNLTVEQVKKDIDRVFAYIEQHTPVHVLDTDGKEVTDYRHIPHGSTLDRGTFRIGSYEWGVTYQALLDASEVTGDARYKDYVVRRFRFLAEVAPGFRKLYEQYKDTDAQMEQILHPKALDDAGAMCCAMMKACIADLAAVRPDRKLFRFHRTRTIPPARRHIRTPPPATQHHLVGRHVHGSPFFGLSWHL